MAELFRDSYGVPHVRGADVLDLARGQGYAAARDRSWQLEYQRRRATGEAAEVLGRPQLGWDVLARRTRMADTARRAHDALGPESQAFVAAFVEGVNAGWDDDAPELRRLELRPTPWEPWVPLAVFHAQHLLFAGLPGRLWHHRARQALDAEESLLSRDPSYLSGSNAWAAGGLRSRDGAPLVGGDPHRILESPGVYSQVRLAVDDEGIDVVGFAFPGVPGVQHFAQATEVAWAITNAAADYQDVFEESLDDVVDGREEVIAVRGAEPVTVEVLATPRGPVFEVDRAGGRGLSLRNPSTVLGDLGFEALLPLLRARSVEDVDRALDHWVEPVNNVVIADRSGTVRFRCAGRVPQRPRSHRADLVRSSDPDGGWTGWLDLDGHDVAPDGQVVTANERRGPESDALGTEFAPPHRADRITSLLTGRDDLTVADFAAIHADAHVRLEVWRTLIGELVVPPAGESVRAAILAWDGVMAADSTGAAAFAAWRSALAARIAAEPVLAPLQDSGIHGTALAPYLVLAAHVGLALERLCEARTPFGIDVRRHAAAALVDAVGHPDTWGETHVLAPTHAFDVADEDLHPPRVPAVGVAGDIDTVRCTGWLPGLTDQVYRGSVARYAWDLGDRRRSGWVVPLGASGDPRSPHVADQVDAWAEARLLPIETDWDRLDPQPSPPG